MSENIIPEETVKVVSDVASEAVAADTERAEEAAAVAPADVEPTPQDTAGPVQDTEDAAEQAKAPDYTGKTLAELSDLFVRLKESAESMTRSKEAEAIKSAFYKLLLKLKGENGAGEGSGIGNPFEAVEQNFKALYADYRKERAEFNRQQDARREESLAKKQAIIAELKALVEGQEDVSAQFPAFRELQSRWREAGPVPATEFRNINDTYQFFVEKFYDMVKINRDLRDLDFKKNLEVKEGFCEQAEKLAADGNVVGAFHELQKLHEQWKEYGPVAKEMREEIWNRFKAATAVINKKYQAHFEGMKEQQVENLAKKTALCERMEEIVAREVRSSSEWNTLTQMVEDIQAEWKRIGFATKKENQKIYDRYRASCDTFFARKRDFYSSLKDGMNENMEKKLALIAEAEALKDSTDWKKTTDRFIELQKKWKEIGAVPRKKSEMLWKRFRGACDEFFASRDANASPENDFYGNLKAKKKLISEVNAYTPAEGADTVADMRGFTERYQAIGHVPFKEKDNIASAFRDAMQQKFPGFSFGGRQGGSGRPGRASRSPKDILIDKYRTLQQNIETYENNIGFFAASKNSAPLIEQMQQRIDAAKAELKELEAQIRKAEEGSAE